MKVADHFSTSSNQKILGQANLHARLEAKYGKLPKYYFGIYPGIVGIEVEVEHWIGSPLTSLCWGVTKDNSLKDNGLEFISIPLQGKSIDYALFELQNIFEDNKQGWYFNHRCSTHVHLNVAQLGLNQLLSLISLYIRLEPWFYAYADPMREASNFCIPLAECALHSEDILNNESLRSKSKYCSLGMNHLHDYGTIELRILEGTSNWTKLRRWIVMYQKLLKYVLVNKLHTKILDFHDKTSNEDVAREVFNTLFRFLPIVPEANLRMARDSSFFFLSK